VQASRFFPGIARQTQNGVENGTADEGAESGPKHPWLPDTYVGLSNLLTFQADPQAYRAHTETWVRHPPQGDHSLTHVSDEPQPRARVVRITTKTFSELFAIINAVSQKRSLSYKRRRSQRAVQRHTHPAGRLGSRQAARVVRYG